MAASVDFDVNFIVDRETPQTAIQVTDTTTGLSNISGIFKIVYPDGYSAENSKLSNPDISFVGDFHNLPLRTSADGKPLRGDYIIIYTLKDNDTGTVYKKQHNFSFQWIEPDPKITDDSDSIIPEVKFSDQTDYDKGLYTENYNDWSISVHTPSTSEVGSNLKTKSLSLSDREIDVSHNNNYYEGVYNPILDIDITYISTSEDFLQVNYVNSKSFSFTINRVPTRTELIQYIKTYKDTVSFKEKTTYDYIVSAYQDLIERAKFGEEQETQELLREIIELLNITYDSNYDATPMQPIDLSDSPAFGGSGQIGYLAGFSSLTEIIASPVSYDDNYIYFNGDKVATQSWVQNEIYNPSFISLGDLNDVDTSGVADEDVLIYDTGTGNWRGRKLAASDIASGTFADARIVLSNVSQHEDQLSIGWSQLTGVPSNFTPSAHSHAASDVTSGEFTDARISESSVFQHLSVTPTELSYLSGVTSSIQTQIDGKEDKSNKGVADGYAPLNSSVKISEIYLPDNILGQVQYQGTWDASTNTPSIPEASSTNKGHYYVTVNSVSASHGYPNIPNESFQEGDWIISNGSAWERVKNSDAVSSVFGRVGAISAAADDYQAGQVGFSSYKTVTSSYVQGAIQELKDELDSQVSSFDSHDHDGRYYTETEINNFFSESVAISGYNKTNWDYAYSVVISGGGLVSNLGDLSNVAITAIQDGQLIRWNDTNSEWENVFLELPDITSGTISLSGDVTGSATFNGASSIDITATVGNDSHTHDTRYYTETEIDNFFSGTTAITGYNNDNWDTAYSWGDHAGLYANTSHTHPASEITGGTFSGSYTFAGDLNLGGQVLQSTHAGAMYIQANNDTTRDIAFRVWDGTSAYNTAYVISNTGGGTSGITHTFFGGVFMEENLNVTEGIKGEYLTLDNSEHDQSFPAFSIWLDANDAAAPVSLGTYAGTHPLGVFVSGDDGGTTPVRLWHEGHFNSTNINNWDTAYGWGDHAAAGYASGSHTHPASDINAGTFSGNFTFASDLTVGNIDIDANMGIWFENKKHLISWNDSNGNFNIRVGHNHNEVITEAGYASHQEWDQGSGWLKFKFSQDGLVGDSISWTNPLTLHADGSSVFSGDVSIGSGNTEVTIGDGTSDADVFINGSAGTNRAIAIRTNGNTRWIMAANNDTESGSNAGSNFDLNRYDDSGGFLGTVLAIERSSGTLSVGGDADFSGDVSIGSGGQLIIDGLLLNESDDRSGLLEIHRKSGVSWTGYSIDFNGQHWSLMGDADTFGIYDDTNGDWILYHQENSYTQLRHTNNVPVIETTSYGFHTGTISTASDRAIRVLSDDDHKAGFEAYGDSQGTGYIYVGQNPSYGGGISYNGDGTPSFVSGEEADRITFYRMSDGSRTEVFSYAHDSNDVWFNSDITINGTARPIQTNAVYFNNTEAGSGYTDEAGMLVFDENYFSDTGYGTGAYDPRTVFSGNGGGILIKNQDGWGAVITSQNMRWLDATFNGVTSTNDIHLSSGNLTRGNHHTGHLEGSHNNVGNNASKSNPIYTIGYNYNPNESSLNNMYGIGYANSGSATYMTSMGSGWGMYVAADGDARIFLNGSDGKGYATNWVGISDERLKGNWDYDVDYLSAIKDIARSGGFFHWKKDGKKDFGIKAQDIQHSAPYLVEGDDYKSVSYMKIGVLNSKMLMNHEDRLTELERENRELKQKLYDHGITA